MGPKLIWFPIPTIRGASAISGTVCEAMTNGRSPRSKKRKRCMTIARIKPTTTPIKNPPIAKRNEYEAAARTAWNTEVSEPLTSGRVNAENIDQILGIAWSEVLNGSSISVPRTFVSSHMSAISAIPASAHNREMPPLEIRPRVLDMFSLSPEVSH